jgi:hypothetical protein
MAAALLVALNACQAPPPRGAPGASLPPEVAGGALYGIDAEASEVLLLVRRAGALATLGHNHVIAVRGLRGRLQLQEPALRSQFDLQFDVARLSVDEPQLRAAVGGDFAGEINASARDGTRGNMLGERVLDASRNATITLQSERISGVGPQYVASTRVTVRGRETLLEVPLQLQLEADMLTARGEFTLQQTALGLTPFSVMLGALSVADELTVRFRIVARRVAV